MRCWLDEGTLGFDGRTWSLTGQVRDSQRRLAVEAALQAAVDTAGWQLAIQAADAAPVVSPFMWSATKAADGRVSLSGYRDDRRAPAASSPSAPATWRGHDGARLGRARRLHCRCPRRPRGAQPSAIGTVKFEGGTWTLAGMPQTTADAEARALPR